MSLRKAMLSASLPITPPQAWLVVPNRTGLLAFQRGALAVTTSFRDYGPLGRWWYVTLQQAGSGELPDEPDVLLVCRDFCAEDLEVELLPVAPIVWLSQRVERDGWRRHPEARALAERRAAQGLVDELLERPDPPVPPTCPTCSSQHWRRRTHVSGERLEPVAICDVCGISCPPPQLWSFVPREYRGH